ncbi:MAG TPA: protein translocase subunit SecD [Bdellovibrionota bacterium]|nr:protein translocase subunit SecD [Bdellovibrionota bacterium]
MHSAWKWRTAASVFSTLLAAYLVLPNFISLPEEKEDVEPPWYVRALPKSKVKLGLDLQGGIHMVLGIDLGRALMNESDRYTRDLKELLKEEKWKIPYTSIERAFESTQITVQLREKEDANKFEELLREYFANVLDVVTTDPGAAKYTLDLNATRQTDAEQQTIRQALETLRNRLDEFGVAEPSIQAQGKDRIIVQLPGLDDPQRAQNVLGRTAQLEFKIVDDESMEPIKLESLVQEAKAKLPQEAKIYDLNRALQGKLPPGTEVRMKEDRDKTTGEVIETPFLMKAETLLTGDMLEDARIGVGEYNQAVVNLQFDPRGTAIVDKVTGENIGKRLAIILDDKIQSDPVIQARIGNGRPQITFGALRSHREIMDEAKDLALVLRAGALPAPVEILQNQAVGPSLGRDSIEKGIKAILVGSLLIVLFMALYYRLAGILADFALITNVMFILAALGALHGTLTLPGLAGILISIGMAVDANVIIYERIREELRAGKTAKQAIEAGYDRAHLTIIDSNFTTIITGIVLLQYGTGSIKGFAITLIFGLVANYFTALWFTRLFYEWYVAKFQPQTVSI